MTGKIFRSSFAVAAAVLLVSAVLLLAVFYEYYGSIQERQLTDELELASLRAEVSHAAEFDDFHENLVGKEIGRASCRERV